MLLQRLHHLSAWFVHLFTASGAVLALLAINAIYQQRYIFLFWMISLAIVVDAIDGTFARWIRVKAHLPAFDGALLDNMVDYLNYVVVPAVFLMMGPLLPETMRFPAAALILLTSAYQFCQTDAKTEDHFFKGFPSYWNIVIFYLYFWQTSTIVNLSIILILALFIFVPIKYVYPSRLENLSKHRPLRTAMLIATITWGAATVGLLFLYPRTSILLIIISMAYPILYLAVSIYKTYKRAVAATVLKMT